MFDVMCKGLTTKQRLLGRLKRCAYTWLYKAKRLFAVLNRILCQVCFIYPAVKCAGHETEREYYALFIDGIFQMRCGKIAKIHTPG